MKKNNPGTDLRDLLGDARARNRREMVARLEKAFTALRGPFADDHARDDFRRRAADLANIVFDQRLAYLYKQGPLPEEPLHSGLGALFSGREIPKGSVR